jgi:hypothetical protein
MREKRVFAAMPGALDRNKMRIKGAVVASMRGRISGYRTQVGACQALIQQGVQVPAHRQWVGVLQGRISVIESQIRDLG